MVVATDGHVFDKVVSNIQEVRARGARVIAVATEGNEEIERHAEDVLWAPRMPALLSPIAPGTLSQLFAYVNCVGPRAERRSAAQPGEDRHRRVEPETVPIVGVGTDVVEIDRFAAALERRPRLAERRFTPAGCSTATRAASLAPSTSPPASRPRRPSGRRSASG